MPRVQRNDTTKLDARSRTAEGYIDTFGNLTRVGVFEYRREDGTIQRELRLPEHVFDPKSIASFDAQPLTLLHPKQAIDSASFKREVVGIVSNPHKADDGIHLRGRVRVMDKDAVDAVDRGTRELSNGYETTLVAIPGGVFRRDDYNGGAEVRADFFQTEILGNHTALVPAGRAGPTARLDSAGNQGDDTVTKEEMEKAIAEAQKREAEMKAKNDALEGENATLKVKIADAEKTEKSRSKSELVARVAPAIKKDAKELEKLDEAGIMREALKVLQPTLSTDGWSEVALSAGLAVAMKNSGGSRTDAATTMASVVAEVKKGEGESARKDAEDEHASETAYKQSRRACVNFKPGAAK